jgi:hypothetical protein
VLQVLGGVQDAAADAGATAGLMGCLMQAVLASPQADKLSQVGQLTAPHGQQMCAPIMLQQQPCRACYTPLIACCLCGQQLL